MIADRDTARRAIKRLRDEGISDRAIGLQMGLSRQSIWAIRTARRSEGTTGARRQLLDDAFAQRGSRATIIVGGHIAGQVEEIKTEIVGYWDLTLIDQIVDANEFPAETHGNQYRKVSTTRAGARPRLISTVRSEVVRTADLREYSEGDGIGQSDAESI